MVSSTLPLSSKRRSLSHLTQRCPERNPKRFFGQRFQRFEARVIAEAHLPVDQREKRRMGLRGVAIGRVGLVEAPLR
jgi:hypothetical protein